jgi:putative FmdB family regulatory protein
MPIYAYKCASCGFAKDVLQKISDPQLTQCPQCGAETFNKQITAAGFQLKGSGWYATDFRGGSTPAADKSTENSAGKATPDSAKTEAKPADSKSTDSKPAVSSPPKSDTPSASAGGCGASCASH